MRPCCNCFECRLSRSVSPSSRGLFFLTLRIRPFASTRRRTVPAYYTSKLRTREIRNRRQEKKELWYSFFMLTHCFPLLKPKDSTSYRYKDATTRCFTRSRRVCRATRWGLRCVIISISSFRQHLFRRWRIWPLGFLVRVSVRFHPHENIWFQVIHWYYVSYLLGCKL